RDGALDLAGIAHVDRVRSERRSRSLDDRKLAGAGSERGIAQDRYSRDVWRDLLEQLQPFRAQTVFIIHEPSDVSARSRQVVDEAGADWIAGNREHNRHRASRL